MTQVTCVATARFETGMRLELDDALATPRAARLTVLRKPTKTRPGLYEVRETVEFKRGTALGVDGTIPKAMRDLLQDPQAAATAAAEALAAADAVTQQIADGIAAGLDAAFEARVAAEVEKRLRPAGDPAA